MSSNVKKKDYDNFNIDCGTCLMLTCCGISILAIFALLLVILYHIVSSITAIAYTSNRDIRAICNENAINATCGYTYNGTNPSEIWMYIITSLIFVSGGFALNLTNAAEITNSKSMGQFILNINISGIVYVIFCGWGWDQIWNSGTCIEYNFGNTEISVAAKNHFYIQVCICCLICLIDTVIVVYAIYMIIADTFCKNSPKSPELTEHILDDVVTASSTIININETKSPNKKKPITVYNSI